jgi:hypothetical protein
MAQSQLSHGGWTQQSVAGDRVALGHLVAADHDLLDNETYRATSLTARAGPERDLKPADTYRQRIHPPCEDDEVLNKKTLMVSW